MKQAIAIRHVAFEDLGTFGPLLAAAGFDISYVEAPLADLATLDPIGADLVIVLGGPIGVYEEAAYPFLAPEIDFIRARLTVDRPTFGICLGAQLMAKALGARVYPGGNKEIGWAPLTLTDAGRDSPLAPLAEGAAVLHWHGDTFDLPSGATNLASTPLYAHQAFSRGRKALGLQFHLEADPAALESWFVGHAAEIAAAPGATVAGLRTETAHAASTLAPLSAEVLHRWLGGAGIASPRP